MKGKIPKRVKNINQEFICIKTTPKIILINWKRETKKS